MGKIDELIQQYCPDGVEFHKIKDVYKRIKGTPITATKMKEIANPAGSVKIFAGGKTVIDANEEDIPNANITRVPAVLVQSRGVIDVVYYEQPFTFKNEMWAYTTENKTSVKYLYYVMKSNVQTFRDAASGMGALPQISLGTTEDFEIPLPPLPVQKEIVRILDNFTNLAAELQAELQARQQQYQYYRDTLLSFDGRDDVQWKKLGEVCIYAKERIGANLIDENNYVSVENLLPNQRGKEKASNVPKEGNCIKFEPNDVLVGNIRPYLHKIWYADCVGGTNGDVLCIRIKDDAKSVIIPRYLYCILSSHSFFEYDNSYSKGAKMPRGDKKKVMEYEFGIPSLSEQQYIVDILDRFDTLTNDLSQGLPAEIEARRQQYEYYRDRLLTFNRKEA